MKLSESGQKLITNKQNKMKKQFVLKAANGKFMSEIYTMNGLYLETRHQQDAKKFDTRGEAQKFIDESVFDKYFIFIEEAENE